MLFGILFLSLGTSQLSKAQTIELLAGNTVNGAMNGVLLGGATMGLQNTNDFEPYLRVGVGTGTLYGIGVGVYDMSTVSIGNQFYISGVFNDGTNSSIIVLLDTFYGAAAGAVIATSVTLIANEPIVEGLQYGSSVGAWAGFGFGIVDSFVLAKRHHISPSVDSSITDQAVGLIRYSSSSENLSIGMLNPAIAGYKYATTEDVGINRTVRLELVNINIKL